MRETEEEREREREREGGSDCEHLNSPTEIAAKSRVMDGFVIRIYMYNPLARN